MKSELTAEVIVKTRPFLARLARFPFVCWKHYRVMRYHGNGVVLSAYGAWLLSGILLTVKTGTR